MVITYILYFKCKHPFIHIGVDTQSKVKGFNRVYNPTNREMLQKESIAFLEE